jgi:hypothetical protein
MRTSLKTVSMHGVPIFRKANLMLPESLCQERILILKALITFIGIKSARRNPLRGPAAGVVWII